MAQIKLFHPAWQDRYFKKFGAVILWTRHLLPNLDIGSIESDAPIHVACAHDLGTGALLQARLVSSPVSLRLELAELWVNYRPAYMVYDWKDTWMGETIENFCGRFGIHIMNPQHEAIKNRADLLHTMSEDVLVKGFMDSLPRRSDGTYPIFDAREIGVLWLHHQIRAKRAFENVFEPNGRDLAIKQG